MTNHPASSTPDTTASAPPWDPPAPDGGEATAPPARPLTAEQRGRRLALQSLEDVHDAPGRYAYLYGGVGHYQDTHTDRELACYLRGIRDCVAELMESGKWYRA